MMHVTVNFLPGPSTCSQKYFSVVQEAKAAASEPEKQYFPASKPQFVVQEFGEPWFAG
jgi:hypothetical protein